MRSILSTFCASVMVAALSACSFSHDYKVVGTAEGAADGDSVFLSDGTSRLVLDTAIITNGEFVFSGRCDTTTFAVLRCEISADGSTNICHVYLERGADIKATLAKTPSKSRAVGSVCNDISARFEDTMSKIVARIDSVEQMARDTTLTMVEQKRYESMSDSLYENVYLTTYTNAVEANIKTVVGVHQLSKIAYAMELETIDSLLNLVPGEYHKDGAYVKLTERVERMKAVDIGRPFVDFALPGLDGDTVRLSEVAAKNKVVMIDFWASWCGPCRREMPNVVKAYEMFKDKGFEIVGVSQDYDADAWRDAVKALGMSWRQCSALKGWDNEAIKAYAISSIPNTVILKDGVIVAHQLTGDDLLGKLGELIHE